MSSSQQNRQGLTEVQKGVAGVISEAIAIIFECSHSNREISKAQQGLGPG